MPRVQVLLSTYNGQTHLAEQLATVLGQDHKELDILIRDDGSIDRTREVLTSFSGDRRVSMIFGDNLGVVGSFFDLLSRSSAEADYIALCDQDDVWLPDKISRALQFLSGSDPERPLLYASRVTVVDEVLRRLEMSRRPRKEIGLGNALAENLFPGCTMVLNRAARDVVSVRLPNFALMHDWWIYLVISAFGEIRFDEESRILYRQHAHNVVGVASGVRRKVLRRISRFVRRNQRITWQVAEFHRLFGNRLTFAQLETVKLVERSAQSLAGRLALASSSKVYRQSRVDDLLLRLVILANRL